MGKEKIYDYLFFSNLNGSPNASTDLLIVNEENEICLWKILFQWNRGGRN